MSVFVALPPPPPPQKKKKKPPLRLKATPKITDLNTRNRQVVWHLFLLCLIFECCEWRKTMMGKLYLSLGPAQLSGKMENARTPSPQQKKENK